MAWPLTPLTTYLAGSLPPIKAADLNAIQNAINRAFAGTYSYAGLVLDGAGGNTVAPAAGSLTASGAGSFGGNLSVGGNATVSGAATVNGAASIGGAATVGQALTVGGNIASNGSLRLGAKAMSASLPGTAVQKGVLYADACPIALGAFSGAGVLRVGFGFQSIQNYGNGTFDITLQNASAGNYETLLPFACGANTGVGVFASAMGTSSNVVRVETYETGYKTNATFAMDFFLMVFAQ